jgi:protein-S-isoprenylcysteine O-methyltransferase Ste14/multidrug efflux pump subunit AcrA (membrane-fusion protein)
VSPAPAYGLWSLVAINTAVFLLFAFSFARPRSTRDWRSFGAFSAFVVALFVEMYGFPLTLYLLSGWLGRRTPQLDLFSHESGHLWHTLFGWEGDPHLDPLHVASWILIGGGFWLLSAAWPVLHRAQREGRLATTGPYARLRHPQYAAFVAIMAGFLLQWPTLLTLLMFPVLVFMYLRLAYREEAEALAAFGPAWAEYAARTPRWLPRPGRHRRPAHLLLGLLGAAFVGAALSAGARDSASAAPPDPSALARVAALGRIEPRHGVYHLGGPPRPAVVIESLEVEEGDRVERGHVIAVLQGIALQRADVARFRAEVSHAEREFARREQLRRGAAASDVALEETRLARDVARASLARAEAELELSLVRSPIDGQILKIHAREGERVGAEGIVEIGETASMYVVAEVYETDIGRVAVGQRASVRSPALARPLTGSVERIGLRIGRQDVLGTDPVADVDARVVEVEVRLDDPAPAARLTNLRVDVQIEP